MRELTARDHAPGGRTEPDGAGVLFAPLRRLRRSLFGSRPWTLPPVPHQAPVPVPGPFPRRRRPPDPSHGQAALAAPCAPAPY
ncbi:hypothetical protein GCM10020221_30060 [Streptomyces thioluteus]|uniref:Uncharacterized protein n=1 Tax=Streptomyces thioluteus TaxID=66431 RepID=A0ABP6JH86_STRTU